MTICPSTRLRANGEPEVDGFKFPFMLIIVEAFLDFFSENCLVSLSMAVGPVKLFR